MAADSKTLLALDVGERRIGVARASAIAGIASPLTTVAAGSSAVDGIAKLLDEQHAELLVVGLPRGLEGQETAQTRAVHAFVAHLKARLSVPVVWQDEALTSHQAEAELTARGKPYDKADIDALAATYILEDYIAGSRGKEYVHV
jgi:putative pre-16S rRNA nuclease